MSPVIRRRLGRQHGVMAAMAGSTAADRRADAAMPGLISRKR
jgi:hypothetical protein